MNKSEIGFELIKSKWQTANVVAREQILLELKHHGLSISETILALTRSGFLSLGEAKEYVSASPAWQAQVESNRELQEIAWQVLDNFKSPNLKVTITEKP